MTRYTGGIMIIEGITRPGTLRKLAQAVMLVCADPGGGEAVGPHQWKVEGQVQFICAIAIITDLSTFTDEEAVRILVDHPAQFLHQFMNTGLPLLVAVDLLPGCGYFRVSTGRETMIEFTTKFLRQLSVVI